MNNTFRLCYVDLPWCYFTTQEISKQWGDDWNDAPYECNSGEPYRGDGYSILKLAIESGRHGLNQPSDNNHGKSSYSVESINDGCCAWLESDKLERIKIKIMAGTMLHEFINLIVGIGGRIYINIDDIELANEAINKK